MASTLIPGYFNLPEDLIAPSGTRCLFHQATMPLGWVSDPNNFSGYAVRTVTSAGGGSTGSVSFNAFNNGGSFGVNAFTISVSQMAAHNHTMTSSHTHSASDGQPILAIGSGGAIAFVGSGGNTVNASLTAAATTGVTLFNAGSGSAVTSATITSPNVKYADHGIGVRS